MKRRQRRNPVPLPFLLIAGALAAAGGVAFVVTRKHPRQTLPNGVQFDPGDPSTDTAGGLDDVTFASLIATDFITADASKLGFNVPGVSAGNVLFQATAGPSLGSKTILAVSRDDRFPDATPRAIPQGAISGVSPA